MQQTIEDGNTSRRSSVIRSEIRGFERALSEAAERHDRYDYAQALNNLNAAKAELRGAEARERRMAKDAEVRGRFKKEFGYADIGTMIATEVQNGAWAAKQRIAAAERSQQIAEAMLTPRPTPEDLAAEALKRITEHTKAVRGGAVSEMTTLTNGVDLGDAA